MKKYILSVFFAIGASLLAPQTAKAQSLSDNGNGYEVEMVYNRIEAIRPQPLSFIRMV